MKNFKPDPNTTIHESMLTTFKSAIVKGSLKPGERLPIRTELETQFGVSRMTVQKVLDRLTRDGFIRSRGHLGTFITEHPPCFHRYGIVFQNSPEESSWGGYHAAMLRVAEEFNHAPARELACYFGVDREGNGEYEALLDDIASERLAGLLFTSGPWHLTRSPVVTQQHIPAMAVMSPIISPSLEHISTLKIDRTSLMEGAIATLARKGCRRPAVLIGEGYDNALKRLQTALKKQGLPYDPARLQGVSLNYCELAEHVTQLWMQLPPDLRPDGLFVADDNLAEWACTGLRKAGVDVNTHLPVMVASNFPDLAVAGLAVERIGFDFRSLITQFINSTDARRSDEAFNANISLPAVLEQDISPVPIDGELMAVEMLELQADLRRS